MAVPPFKPPALLGVIGLQWHFHVTPTVHQMVLTLEGAGFIKRKQGVARSIELDPENLPVLR